VTERGKQRGDDQKREEERRRTGREDEDQREEKALRARLDRLSSALEAHQDPSAQNSGQDAAPAAGSLGSAMSLGFRVLSEFVAAVIVGAVIGWQIDVWTGASPVFLLVFLLFGTAAGFWNVYRIAVKPPGSKGGLV
jgi:ATP synthase protein I